jgi:hypothetical protein
MTHRPFIVGVTAVSTTSAQVHWRAPLNDGGAAITCYRVQHRQVSRPRDRIESLNEIAARSHADDSATAGWTAGPLHAQDVLQPVSALASAAASCAAYLVCVFLCRRTHARSGPAAGDDGLAG